MMKEIINQIERTLRNTLDYCVKVKSNETKAKSKHKVLTKDYIIEAQINWKITKLRSDT